MVHSLPFMVLRVPDAIWSATLQPKFLAQVTPKGLNPDGTLTEHGILQVHLLMTEVFDTSHDDEVRDIRPLASRR
jgi:hypothetical protein